MESQFKLPVAICPNLRVNNDANAVKNAFFEAISSGIGVICFSPDLYDVETLIHFIDLVKITEGEVHQNVKGFVWASLTDSNHNQIIEILDNFKVVGVKISLNKENENGSVGIKNWDSLEKLLWMMKQKGIDKPISIFQGDESELCSIERLVTYAHMYPDFRYLAGQVTSAKGIEIITYAQNAGLKIMIELTPYHLFFNNASETDGDFIKEFLEVNLDNPFVCIGSDSVLKPKGKRGLVNTMQHIVKIVLNFSDKLRLSTLKISDITSTNIAKFLGIPQMNERCVWEFDPHPDNTEYCDVPNTFKGFTMCYKLYKKK